MVVQQAQTQVAPSRRERMRALTLEEIRTAARDLLAEHGHTGLTTRAIARVVGMTSPALYRYFASHEELVDAVLADLFDELSEHLRGAVAPGTEPLAALVGTCRAMRQWALLHVREFEFMLIYPMSDRSVGPVQLRARRDFGGVMLSRLAAAAAPERMAPVTAAPDAVAAMVEYCRNCGVELDPAVAPAAVQCWMRLYGSISMLTMGQLEPLGEHADAVFEQELVAMSALLGHADGV